MPGALLAYDLASLRLNAVLLLELVEPLDLQSSRGKPDGKHVVLGPQIGLVLV